MQELSIIAAASKAQMGEVPEDFQSATGHRGMHCGSVSNMHLVEWPLPVDEFARFLWDRMGQPGESSKEAWVNHTRLLTDSNASKEQVTRFKLE